MHVAHVLGYLAPRYGGPPQVAIHLGQALAAHGVTISWWATATQNERQELAYLGNGAHLFTHAFPLSWFYSAELHRTLAKEMPGIDLLHLHQVWDYPVYAAARLARETQKPYLLTPHGIFSQSWRYQNSLRKRLYFRFVVRPLLDRASCIHAVVSAELEGFWEAGVRAPCAVIQNGVWPREFDPLPLPVEADERWPTLRGRRVVLFLGRLSPEKGLDLLVRAWKQVVSERNDVMLLIAGPDHRGYRASVEAMVGAVTGLADSVLLTGMLRGEEKRMALSRAEVFVLPSYTEVLGLAVLEAMASGKPCVITTGCNFPEVVQAGCGSVVPPQAELLGAALNETLALTSAERQEMGERGRALVAAHYNWDIIARRWLTVYRRILAGAPIPLHPEAAA